VSELARAVMTPLSKLKAWPKNPRTIDPQRMEQLKASLREDAGMLEVRPLVALPDGTVIMGNQRLRAARELGWKELPVATVDLDEATAEGWAIRDNQNYGDWDRAALGAMLEQRRESGVDLEALGFRDDEITVFLAAAKPPVEMPKDPEAVPPVPAEPESKPGEVYELGPHRLLCGDATSSDDAATLMMGEESPLCFTSPPYADAREYNVESPLDLSPARLARFIPTWAPHADLIACNLGLLRHDFAVVPYWNAYLEEATRAGLALLSWNVWDRMQPWSVAHNTALFPIEHEWVFVWGIQEKHRLNLTVPNKTPGIRTGITNRQPDGSLKKTKLKLVRERRALGTVFRSPPHIGKDAGHPAMFPVVFPQAYIEAASDPGDVIVDPFAGAGTTMVAAHATGRRAFMVEISPAYCDVVRERWRRLTEGS